MVEGGSDHLSPNISLGTKDYIPNAITFAAGLMVENQRKSSSRALYDWHLFD